MAATALPPFVCEALPECFTWNSLADEAVLRGLPPAPALLLLIDAEQRPVLLATTQHLRRFVTGRLAVADQAPRPRADLRQIVRGVRWRTVASPLEGRWWHYRVARVLYPDRYREMLAFGPAWFLHLDARQRVPQIRVSNRIWCTGGQFVGPWPTRREAQETLDGLCDLFDLCRYPEQVQRTPHGTRCAYYDMGRCDAPCDGTALLEPYVERCRQAWAFVCGRMAPWIEAAETRMRAAAREQRYEEAARLKQQIDLVRRWQREWPGRIRLAEQWNDLLALPVGRRRAWKLLLFRQGDLLDGPVLRERDLPGQAAEWARQQMQAETGHSDATVRMEQTWMVAHFAARNEAARAVVVPLGATAITQEVARRLEETLKAKRPTEGAKGMRDPRT